MDKWIFICIFLLCGCKNIKYIEVPVEVEKVKIEYRDSFQKDSLSTKDSIYVSDSIFIFEKGDTIFQIKKQYIYKDRIIYQDKINLEDSHKIDSIPYIKIVEKPIITNQLKGWQKFFIVLGIIVCLCILGVLFWKLFNFLKIKK